MDMVLLLCFFFNATAIAEFYTLSLHDALPISAAMVLGPLPVPGRMLIEPALLSVPLRSEEHTSELQSLRHLVCRLLLEKKVNPLAKVRSELVPPRLWARRLSIEPAEVTKLPLM